MIPFPNIDPVLIRVGPIQIRWYGLMYLFGFASSWYLVRHQVRRRALPITEDDISGLYTWCIMGLLLGARLGYVVFYQFSWYLENPLDILAVWRGGMSFHGGLIGSIVAGVLFARREKIPVFLLSDLVMATAPIGLFFGRMGNFINGELFGRPTTLPWGMVFPLGGRSSRHPSQLYEAFFEGLILFAVLWTVKGRFRREGGVTALFFILYGTMRFAIEYVSEPDAHLGFVLGPFTMGQLLCAAMVVVGGGLLLRGRNRPEEEGRAPSVVS